MVTSLSRRIAATVVLIVVSFCARAASAQTPQEPVPAGHDMSHMLHGDADASGAPSMTRDGSGTSWLPDLSPMHAYHWQTGRWTWMGHVNLFVQSLKDAGPRGHDQTGSINWLMLMAQHPAAGGTLAFRGMVSAEGWTIAGCGYPDLLASGETCGREAIHDQQHPHDAFMELTASLDHPLHGAVRWRVYGGPAGEPALGPVAFPHRLSAASNPVAPISHHWLDSTHIAYGVVTGALYSTRWKADVSAFNGREPDENRTDMDFGPFDSYSGRFTWMPSRAWALQVSAGHLEEGEAADHAQPARDVDRVTASATYHRRFDPNGFWANTIAWGRNAEGGSATQSLLFESSVTLHARHVVFGRAEVGARPLHSLGFHGAGPEFTVAKLQGGYVRYLGAWGGLTPGAGVSVSSGIVPGSLRGIYGSRANAGIGVFVTLRPAEMRGH